jgi:hypothetical protein
LSRANSARTSRTSQSCATALGSAASRGRSNVLKGIDFAEIGLVDPAPEARSGPDAAGAAFDDEEEIISEAVIRERLIEWLAGFLT